MQSGLRWCGLVSCRRFPGLFQPYAPPTVALVLCWHSGFGQLLRKCFWSVAYGQVSCVCPAHPLGLATLRGHWPCAGLPVRPQGAPSEPRRVRGQGSSRRCAPADYGCGLQGNLD